MQQGAPLGAQPWQQLQTQAPQAPQGAPQQYQAAQQNLQQFQQEAPQYTEQQEAALQNLQQFTQNQAAQRQTALQNLQQYQAALQQQQYHAPPPPPVQGAWPPQQQAAQQQGAPLQAAQQAAQPQGAPLQAAQHNLQQLLAAQQQQQWQQLYMQQQQAAQQQEAPQRAPPLHQIQHQIQQQYQQQFLAAQQQYAEQQQAAQQHAEQQHAEQQQAALQQQYAAQQHAEQQAALQQQAAQLQAQQAEHQQAVQQQAALLPQAQQAAQQAAQQQAAQLQAPPQAPPPRARAQPPVQPQAAPAPLQAPLPRVQQQAAPRAPLPRVQQQAAPVQPPPNRSLYDEPALQTYTYNPNPLDAFIHDVLSEYHTIVPGTSTDGNALSDKRVKSFNTESELFGIYGTYKGVTRMVLSAYEFKTIDPDEHVIEFPRNTSSSRRYVVRNYGDPANPALSFYLAAIKQLDRPVNQMQAAIALRSQIAPLANNFAAALGHNPNFHTEAADTEVFIAYAAKVGDLCVFNAVSKCATMYSKGGYIEDTLYPEGNTLVIYHDGGNCFQSLELKTEKWEDTVSRSCRNIVQNHAEFYSNNEPFNTVARKVYPATSLVAAQGSKFVVIGKKTEVYSLEPYTDVDRNGQYGLSFYTALANNNLSNAILFKSNLAQIANRIATSLGRKIDFGEHNRGADTEVFFAYVELTNSSLCVYNDATKVAIMYNPPHPANPGENPIYIYNDGKNRFQRLTKLNLTGQPGLELPPPVAPEGTFGYLKHYGKQWYES